MTVITATTTAINRANAAATVGRPVVVRPAGTDAMRTSWKEYVEQTSGGTLFHAPAWADAVEAVFGHTALHHVAIRDDKVVGVLPLMEVKSFLAGRLLVSVPYATYGGILADDDEVRDALAGTALRLVYERGVRLLELRSEEAVVPGIPVDDRYSAFTKALPPDLDAFQRFLPKRARAAARQGVNRDGLSVTHGREQLKTVYDLYTRSMRRLASVNYPYAFFEKLDNQLGDDCWVSIVRKDNQPILGVVSFVYGDTVMPYFIGADERIHSSCAANVVFSSLMERAVEAKVKQFDYGRTRTDNKGPFSFKKNQGFEPRTLGYQRFTPKGRTDPNLSPSNPKYDIPRKIWAKLPLTVTRPLGSWLSRSIPG